MATCSREGFQSFGVASSLSTERTFRGRGRDGDWNTQDKAARVGIGLTLVFVQLLSEPQVDLFKLVFHTRFHRSICPVVTVLEIDHVALVASRTVKDFHLPKHKKIITSAMSCGVQMRFRTARSAAPITSHQPHVRALLSVPP
jgi:hypothetical protein